MKQWPGISAITLFVDDLDTAKTFYQDVFALPIHFEDPQSVVFDFGGTLINLLVEPAVPEVISPAALAPSAAGARVVFTLAVEDVDDVHRTRW